MPTRASMDAVGSSCLAAEQGYAPAQYNLGVMYANGEGVAKNDEQAVKWYRKAAEQGDEDAKKLLEKLER